MSVSTHVHILKVANKVDSMLKSAESQLKVQNEVVKAQKLDAISKRPPYSSSIVLATENLRTTIGEP